MPKVLLTSPFKPYGVDSLYGRVDSTIECLHNRITRFQSPFSPRMHYQSFGLYAIANNIEADTVVLDFPTLKRFKREVARGYDYIGIGSVPCNFQKVKRMVKEIRQISPKSEIILGGFCSTIPHIKELLGVDYVCTGEGISFMRQLTGLDPEFEFRNPDVYSKVHQIFGVPIFWKNYRLHIVVGLGCPYACDFCSPSHFFGRKHVKFLKTGEDIYKEMVRLADKYKEDNFTFVGDDNFLADRDRAEELRKIVLEKGRQFKLFIFGSADLVEQWDPVQLAEMGIYAIWIGRESKFSDYPKNENMDIKAQIARLRKVGIKVTLSSMLLVDGHDKKTVWEDIDEHFDCEPAYSQFSFLGPVHGTPLWDRLTEEGRLPSGLAYEEMYAFKQPWFVHPHFTLEEAEELQDQAYLRNFHQLGPSIVRNIEVDFEGYLNLKDSQSKYLKERAELLMADVSQYKAILLASELLVPKSEMVEPIRELRRRIEAEFGKTTLFEKTMAAGLFTFGTKQKLVEKYFGDVIQPKTWYFRYNHQ